MFWISETKPDVLCITDLTHCHQYFSSSLKLAASIPVMCAISAFHALSGNSLVSISTILTLLLQAGFKLSSRWACSVAYEYTMDMKMVKTVSSKPRYFGVASPKRGDEVACRGLFY